MLDDNIVPYHVSNGTFRNYWVQINWSFCAFDEICTLRLIQKLIPGPGSLNTEGAFWLMITQTYWVISVGFQFVLSIKPLTSWKHGKLNSVKNEHGITHPEHYHRRFGVILVCLLVFLHLWLYVKCSLGEVRLKGPMPLFMS